VQSLSGMVFSGISKVDESVNRLFAMPCGSGLTASCVRYGHITF
jgi:hypothetical protein